MDWGAEILEWDGMSIDRAVAKTETLWFARPQATSQTVSVAKHQLVTRAPVGVDRRVVFRNRGDASRRTTTLSAYDDNYASLRSRPFEPETSSPIWHQSLENQVGYVRIGALETSVDGAKPVEAMNQAIRELSTSMALILDVRGNRGGPDHLVPAMMGYFTHEPLHYKNIAGQIPIINKTVNLFSLTVQPDRLQYTGPVVVLVDHRTKSSGEGFALIAKQLPNMIVLGTEGTDDGDHQLRRGVQPDIVVPLTLELADAAFRDGRDIVLEAAIDELSGFGCCRGEAALRTDRIGRSTSSPWQRGENRRTE